MSALLYIMSELLTVWPFLWFDYKQTVVLLLYVAIIVDPLVTIHLWKSNKFSAHIHGCMKIYSLHTHKHTSMHARVCLHMCPHAHTHACRHTHTHTHTQTDTHTCMHAHMHAHTHRHAHVHCSRLIYFVSVSMLIFTEEWC